MLVQSAARVELKSSPRGSLTRTCLALTVLLLAVGCSKGDELASQGSSFWSTFRMPGADEVEQYDSIREMTASADAVVVGEIRDFELSRTLQGDAQEDVVTYGKATLVISAVLSGNSYGDTVALEFLLAATTAEEAARIVDDIRGDLPAGDLVVFLRDKGGDEAGFFRVTNSTGLWASTGRSALDTPMTEESPNDSRLYEAELAGIDSIPELVGLIAGYGP